MSIFNMTLAIVAAFIIIMLMNSPVHITTSSNKWWKSDYDETDNPKIDRYSGMLLYIDYGTGCQYLSNSVFSGLVPRLDDTGKQICKKGTNDGK